MSPHAGNQQTNETCNVIYTHNTDVMLVRTYQTLIAHNVHSHIV